MSEPIELADLFTPMKMPRTWWSPSCGLVQDVPTALYVHVASGQPMVAVPEDAVELAPRAKTPDRAAARRDVEALLASVTNVDDRRMFFLADDERREFLTAPELAALIVDRVLGTEHDGGGAASS